MIIDNKLNFKTHIHNVENKVSRSVGILSKLRFLLPSQILLQLYCTLVHPPKLQYFQNKAVRIISNFKFKAPLTPQFKKVAVLKIIGLYNLELGKIMHQHSRQILLPCFITDLLNLLLKITYMFRNIRHLVAKNQLSIKGQLFGTHYR